MTPQIDENPEFGRFDSEIGHEQLEGGLNCTQENGHLEFSVPCPVGSLLDPQING